jgi:hypothetical protein
VGDDGGGALLLNPAAMARREGKRVQLGVALIDDNIDSRPATGGAPTARDQAGSTLLPLVAAEGALGDWILGIGAMTGVASDRALRSPGRLPVDQYADLFDYRYAGISGSLRQDTVTIGAARRLGDAVAVGLAIAGSRVAIAETRRVWADHRSGETVGDPNADVDLALDASDPFVPSAVAGVLVAPSGTRFELGASLTWSAAARARGGVTASAPGATSVVTTSAASTIDLREPLTARAGARYDASHWIVEVGADVWMTPSSDAVWSVQGIHVVDATGTGTDLVALPSRLATHTHGAVRGAVDVELVAGFLWATAGYAYTTPATHSGRLSPTFGELEGHTAALGLEASAGGFTISLGWARTWSIARTPSVSDWRYDNPFGAPDGAIPAAHLDGSRDLVGISIDAELDAPR